MYWLILFVLFSSPQAVSYGPERNLDTVFYGNSAPFLIAQASKTAVGHSAPATYLGKDRSIQSDSSDPFGAAKSETRTESSESTQSTNPEQSINLEKRDKKTTPFKRFVPSEKIEADHAVDFPADI
jgi:hypothetical protein